MIKAALLKRDSTVVADNDPRVFVGDKRLIDACLDSTQDDEFFSLSGHFGDSAHCENLVLVNTSLFGVSVGSYNNLLVLLDANRRIRMIKVIGNLRPTEDVRDLNGDGLPEVCSASGYTWMGEYGEVFNVFTLKGGVPRELYMAHSRTFDDDGRQANERYSKGDTFAVDVVPRLIDPDRDGRYEVRQVRSAFIYQGGRTEEEARQRAKVSRDSSTVQLK